MEVGRGCCGPLEAVPGCGGDRVTSAPHVTGAGCMAHGDLADARGVSDEQCMFFEGDLVRMCVKLEIGWDAAGDRKNLVDGLINESDGYEVFRIALKRMDGVMLPWQ